MKKERRRSSRLEALYQKVLLLLKKPAGGLGQSLLVGSGQCRTKQGNGRDRPIRGWQPPTSIKGPWGVSTGLRPMEQQGNQDFNYRGSEFATHTYIPTTAANSIGIRRWWSDYYINTSQDNRTAKEKQNMAHLYPVVKRNMFFVSIRLF